jgi:mRNA interferase MazF
MGTLAASQVVIVPLPFSDLTASKLRSAVVLADAGREDWTLASALVLRMFSAHFFLKAILADTSRYQPILTDTRRYRFSECPGFL